MKSEPCVASAFRSIFDDQKFSRRKLRLILVRTEEGISKKTFAGHVRERGHTVSGV